MYSSRWAFLMRCRSTSISTSRSNSAADFWRRFAGHHPPGGWAWFIAARISALKQMPLQLRELVQHRVGVSVQLFQLRRQLEVSVVHAPRPPCLRSTRLVVARAARQPLR